MMLWAAVSCVLTVQEPDSAALRKENGELKERVTQLEAAALEDARHIHRLRQLVKVLQEQAAALESVAKAGSPASAPAARPTVESGPEKPLKGKVAYVDAKNGFITLGIGKKDGVQVGYKFEIYRETLEAGGETRLTRVALGEVEKFMGQDSMSKVAIKEGMAGDVRLDDVAVAIRKLPPVAPAPAAEGGPAPAPPSVPAPDPVNGIFGITGTAGNSFILNYGGLHGAKQTDLVYVQAGAGQVKAKLRIDRVDKNFSVAGVVDGSQVSAPAVGDPVLVREPRKVLSGKIALCDDKSGKVAVDLRQRDGVKIGQKLEARRLGQKVGLLLVTEVQSWGSWAKPEGDGKIEDFKKGDFVEAVER